MEKGYISTDLIEEVLGGEQYDRYRKAKNWEESLQKDFGAKSKELETLRNSGDLTDSQRERLAELQKTVPQLGKQLENVKATSTLALMKAQMTNDVYQSTKSDARLRESFFERVRSTQAYRNDVTKYNEKQRQTIQKAIDSGILNNTGKTHDFVDLLARISADKGIVFDFTDNKRLKDSPFALEGKNVNGFVTKDGITLNINSHNTVNAVAGHEVTHVLEGTEFYNELQKAVFDYARAKGELGSRWGGLKERYKGMDADINAELTSDLVGDYLFTDSDFLARLSTDNRNVFEKVFDEIKYLCRVATAGSQEARKLEKVKKAFEEAYRAETKNTVTEDGVRYSLRKFENRMQTSADAENDYKRWSKSIGINESAKTLAEFYNIKYNKPDEYELLKQYAKDVESGWISPLSGFENYKNIYNRIQNEIVGKTAANGIVITGQVPHFMQRVVGTMVDPQKLMDDSSIIRRSGVEIETVIDAVFNPVEIGETQVRKSGKRSVKLIGEKCAVTINPDTGELIQTNPV